MKSYLPADSSATSLWGMGGIFVIGVAALGVGVAVMLMLRRGSADFFAGRRYRAGSC